MLKGRDILQIATPLLQDELETELEEVEGAELVKLLLQPAKTALAAPVPTHAGRQQIGQNPQQSRGEKVVVLQEGMTL